MSRPPNFESYPPPSEHVQYQQSSSPTLVILTVLLLVFFFTGFFLVYFWRCFAESLIRSLGGDQTQSTTLNPSVNQGLDPTLLQSFPVFLYSSVKDLREDKYGLECAICLLEFEDDSLLRYLTICCHVFHKECIDLWLTSHKTCPVCRRDLDFLMKGTERTPVLMSEHGSMHEDADNDETTREEDVRIDIRESDDHPSHHIDSDHDQEHEEQKDRVHDEIPAYTFKQKDVEKFPRSHSTGHSIISVRRGGGEESAGVEEGEGGGEKIERVAEKEEEEEEGKGKSTETIDRHTLKLPEKIKAKLFRGHHCTRSCTTFNEMAKDGTCNCAFAEISSSSLNINARKS